MFSSTQDERLKLSSSASFDFVEGVAYGDVFRVSQFAFDDACIERSRLLRDTYYAAQHVLFDEVYSVSLKVLVFRR